MENNNNNNIDENEINYSNEKDTNIIFKIIINIFLVLSIIFFILFNLYIFTVGTQGAIDKPIIYIYPEEKTEVSVTLENPEKITTNYPNFSSNSTWDVTAYPDGTLIDKDGNKYYSLYWEGKNSNSKISNEGFVIDSKNVASFLEEKLEILGLNYKEKEEFIVYWLPKLQQKKYVYIRFETLDEINKKMPLNISPKPDTLIRVLMDWKGLDKKIDVSEQNLTKVERSGYTVVEWGGSEIK